MANEGKPSDEGNKLQEFVDFVAGLSEEAFEAFLKIIALGYFSDRDNK